MVPATSSETPIFASVAVVAVAVLSVLLLCCWCRKKRMRREAASPGRRDDPRLAGVRSDRPVQFVVPTTTTTEDSETDGGSSGGTGRKIRRSGGRIRPEELQRGLYVPVSGKRGPFDGKVGFELRHNTMQNRLTVRVLGPRPSSVDVSLLPDRIPGRKEATDSFHFRVRRADLAHKRLRISVRDGGRVLYNLADAGLAQAPYPDAGTGEMWVDLRRDSQLQQRTSESGEVLLSLCYDPDSSTLTLAVLKIRGLDMKQQDTVIYAKVGLYFRHKLVRRKKTPSRKKKSPEVEVNSPFCVRVAPAALSEVDLTVSVCEKGPPPLGKKRVLGRTHTGSNDSPPCEHWQDMMASPKSTSAQWHTLCSP